MRFKGIVFIPLLMLAHSSFAERYFIGGGVSQIWINSDHPAIGSQSATGFQFTSGVIWEHLGLDFTLGGATLDTGEVTDIYYPPDSADYGIIDLGVKYYFRIAEEDRIVPWVGAGIGLHLISWDTYWYNVDGSSYSLCAGFDARLISNAYLRTGLKYHSFTSDDTYDYGPYDGETFELDVGVIWLFGKSLK